MRDFLNKPFVLHVMIAVLTVMAVVLNARLNLGMDQDQIHATIALGIALILGKSVHDAANIVGDAHVEAAEIHHAASEASDRALIEAQKSTDAAMISAQHVANGNNPDGTPKT